MNSPNEKINEKETNSQGQKPKTSKLAMASLLVIPLGFLFVWLFAIADDVLPGYRKVLRVFGLLALILHVTSPLTGLVLGIASLVRIKISKGRLKGYVCSVSAILFALPLLMINWKAIDRIWSTHPRIVCMSNLVELGKVIMIYAGENDGKYPVVDKWCDLLLEHTDVSKKQFICPSAEKGRCHYAMNPNCHPDSPQDMVLLFETEDGWNQFGGPEILTTENHKGKGCNVLFNDIHVAFIKTENLSRLKWRIEETKNE